MKLVEIKPTKTGISIYICCPRVAHVFRALTEGQEPVARLSSATNYRALGLPYPIVRGENRRLLDEALPPDVTVSEWGGVLKTGRLWNLSFLRAKELARAEGITIHFDVILSQPQLTKLRNALKRTIEALMVFDMKAIEKGGETDVDN